MRAASAHARSMAQPRSSPVDESFVYSGGNTAIRTLPARPSLTGSSATPKTMGIVVVASLAANAEAAPPGRGDHGDLPANQVGRQLRQSISLILRPAIYDPTFSPST